MWQAHKTFLPVGFNLNANANARDANEQELKGEPYVTIVAIGKGFEAALSFSGYMSS